MEDIGFKNFSTRKHCQIRVLQKQIGNCAKKGFVNGRKDMV